MEHEHRLLTRQRDFSAFQIENIKQEQLQGLYPKDFKFPIGLQFEFTSKCGLYCKHCYNASGVSSGDEIKKDKMLFNDWKKVIDDVLKEGGIFQCILSGGEPLLLGDSLFELIDPLHDDGTGFILITNGLVVTKEIVSKLKKYSFYWVQVSIDDVLRDEHDNFRGKQGSWDKAVNAAYLFSGTGFPLRIAHAVTPANIERLDSMIDLSYKLGASSMVCGTVMQSGRAVANKDLFSNEDEFLYQYYDIVERNQCKYRGKMDILTSSDLMMDINKKKNTPNTAAVIRPNGDVRVDCTMPFTIGNVLEESITEIWKKIGFNCWKHEKIVKHISELDKFGVHPIHKNHQDLDIRLEQYT